MEKISHDRRAYESVDDTGAYLRLYLKNWWKKVLGWNGLNVESFSRESEVSPSWLRLKL